MDSKQLPIGYYIKKADHLLTRAIDEIQAASQLTRIGWQVLHSIHEEGQLDEATLAILMRPFVVGERFQNEVERLTDAGLITTKGGALTLTESGMVTHWECLGRQQEFRKQVMTGVSPQEYEQAILTLKKMIDNIQGV
jgi:hypothetical protein